MLQPRSPRAARIWSENGGTSASSRRELPVEQRNEARRPARDDGGCAPARDEHPDLAEEVARAERRERLAVADDLGLAVDDRVEVVGEVVPVDDLRPLGHRDLVGDRRDSRAVHPRGGRREGDRLENGGLDAHAARSSHASVARGKPILRIDTFGAAIATTQAARGSTVRGGGLERRPQGGQLVPLARDHTAVELQEEHAVVGQARGGLVDEAPVAVETVARAEDGLERFGREVGMGRGRGRRDVRENRDDDVEPPGQRPQQVAPADVDAVRDPWRSVSTQASSAAAALVSLAQTSACGQASAIATASAPLPVPMSAIRAGRSPTRARAAATSGSLVARGVITRPGRPSSVRPSKVISCTRGSCLAGDGSYVFSPRRLSSAQARKQAAPSEVFTFAAWRGRRTSLTTGRRSPPRQRRRRRRSRAG